MGLFSKRKTHFVESDVLVMVAEWPVAAPPTKLGIGAAI